MPAAGFRLALEDTEAEAMELRDFSRTVAEIEWLLVILVLLYHFFQGSAEDDTVAIYLGLIAFSALVVALHYTPLVPRRGRWLLALEVWFMIVFITWVLYHTGRLESPLLNLYLLPIVVSALTLGQAVTLLQMALIAACYLFLGYTTDLSFFSIISAGNFAADLAPMLLVAYITTMLSADILNAMAKIKLISETDALTGAFNVRAFNAIAERECGLAQRYNRTFTLMMIDSDNLKKVNDGHGHAAGDQLIKATAAAIRGELRSTDVVARYGGDEFICLLSESGPGAARTVAERIRARVAATPLRVGGADVATSVSIGLATYPDHGDRLETVAHNADKALYLSKSAGRNRVTVYAAP
jgi:diguanylate cyclase (GGDEF)-like protein